MKILVFSQLYSPETATITDVCRDLTKKGHEVTVMTGLPNAPGGNIFEGYGYLKKLKENLDGVDVRRNWLVPRGGGSNLRMILNYLSFVLFCSLGLFRIRNKTFDVILVNQLSPITVALPAILYKFIYRKKIVMWVHDLWPDSVIAAKALSEGLVYKIIGQIVKFIYSHVDFFLPQSVAMLNTLEERGIHSSCMKYTPNPIDDIFINNISKSQKIKRNFNEPCRIMFAGGIGAAQDFDTILNALSLACSEVNLKILVVGDGRALDRAKNLANDLELNDNIEFLGRHPVESMPKFYEQADFMLVTLLDESIFSVTVPLKIQTYMSAGKPIICNVRGEAARVIDDARCGFSAPPESPKALAKAFILAAKTCDAERFKMQNSASKYFNDNYSKDVIIDSFEEVLQKYC